MLLYGKEGVVKIAQDVPPMLSLVGNPNGMLSLYQADVARDYRKVDKNLLDCFFLS